MGNGRRYCPRGEDPEGVEPKGAASCRCSHPKLKDKKSTPSQDPLIETTVQQLLIVGWRPCACRDLRHMHFSLHRLDCGHLAMNLHGDINHLGKGCSGARSEVVIVPT